MNSPNVLDPSISMANVAKETKKTPQSTGPNRVRLFEADGVCFVEKSIRVERLSVPLSNFADLLTSIQEQFEYLYFEQIEPGSLVRICDGWVTYRYRFLPGIQVVPGDPSTLSPLVGIMNKMKEFHFPRDIPLSLENAAVDKLDRLISFQKYAEGQDAPALAKELSTEFQAQGLSSQIERLYCSELNIGLVHGELQPQNLLEHDGNYYLIDWDSSGFDKRIIDVASSMLFFCRLKHGSFDISTELVASLSNLLGLQEDDRLRVGTAASVTFIPKIEIIQALGQTPKRDWYFDWCKRGLDASNRLQEALTK